MLFWVKRLVIFIILVVSFVAGNQMKDHFLYKNTLKDRKMALYHAIPNIYVYNTDLPLKQVLTVQSRAPNIIYAQHRFSLYVSGEIVIAYYKENLMKDGWSYISYEKEFNKKGSVKYFV